MFIHGHWGALSPTLSYSAPGTYSLLLTHPHVGIYFAQEKMRWLPLIKLRFTFVFIVMIVITFILYIFSPWLHLLCVAGFSPGPLHSARWPPAPFWPPLWSYPSSEPLSGPGSWLSGSTATWSTHIFRYSAVQCMFYSEWYTVSLSLASHYSLCCTPIC